MALNPKPQSRPFTPEAAQRLADLWHRRFHTPDNPWADLARLPENPNMGSEGWSAYYGAFEDDDPGRWAGRSNPRTRSNKSFNGDALADPESLY